MNSPTDSGSPQEGMSAHVAASDTTFIADVVAGRVELPTIARVVQRLITGLRRSDASLAGISADLAQDPVLCARVLRLANSPFYGGRRSLSSIDDAVAAIGTDALRTLVITCGVSSAFVQVPGINLAQFWREAVVTATAARWVLQQAEAVRGLENDSMGESAYVAGLLLATGHLILCQVHPHVAAAHFTRYQNLRGAPLATLEDEVFGISHPVVGALWVDRLGFPSEVVASIRNALEPVTETTSLLDAAVRMGTELAVQALAGASINAAVGQLDAKLIRHLGLKTVLDPRREHTPFATHYAALKTLEWLA